MGALALAVAMCVIGAGVEGNVIGIDFGTDLTKVALVMPGSPLEIVTNIHSKRKTENALAFYRGERSFGADAYALLTKSPQSTYAKLTTMLGRSVDHPALKLLAKQYYPTEAYYNESRGGLAIKYGEDFWTPEELTAMILTYMKEITTSYSEKEKGKAGVVVRDCVITVPFFYTQHERQALLDAAQIADLRVLSLMDENTAAALQYGLDRVFEETHRVLIYNLGANSAQASIIEYSSKTVKEGSKNKTIGQFEVLGKAWDANLGGFNWDLLIMEYMADEFNKKWGEGKDVRQHARPMAKLRAQSKKVKEVLSANKDTPIHIPSLHDDIDFATQLSRAQLEAMSSDLAARLTAPIDRVLKAANLTMADINVTEIVGGAVRIPRVHEVLKEYLGDHELGQHLNGDEAMALGAAFHAANLSTAFRVRKVLMTDVTPFPIGVRLSKYDKPDDEGLLAGMLSSVGLGGSKESTEAAAENATAWSKRASLFKEGNKLDTKRTIAFLHDDDIVCNLTYDASELLPPDVEPTLAVYNISGIASFAKEMDDKGLGKPKVHLSFTLDSSGICALTKAEATVEEILEPAVNASNETADGNGTEAENTTAPETAEAETAESADKEANATATDADNATDANASKNATESPVAAKPKKKTHRRQLTVVESIYARSYHALQAPEKATSIARLAELQRQDDIRKEKQEAKNTLESYALQARGRVLESEEEVDTVATPEQKQEVLTLIEETEEWLYGDGDDAEAGEYYDKERGISVLLDAIFLRVTEKEKRPKAVEDAKSRLAGAEALVLKWEKDKPHITETERGDVTAKVEKIRAWLEEKEAAQAEIAATEPAVFVSKDVDVQIAPLSKLVDRLNKKPKPVPKKNATNDTNASANGTTNASANGTNTTQEPADATEDAEQAAPSESEEDAAVDPEEKEMKDEL